MTVVLVLLIGIIILIGIVHRLLTRASYRFDTKRQDEMDKQRGIHSDTWNEWM